jgi:Fe(3+) dicitrate transport protein
MILLFWAFAPIAAQFRLSGTVSDSLGNHIAKADVYLQEKNLLVSTAADGSFVFSNLERANYTLLLSKAGFLSHTIYINGIQKDTFINVLLLAFEMQAPTVTVNADDRNGLQHFRAVDWDNMLIGAAKKSEIISLDPN